MIWKLTMKILKKSILLLITITAILTLTACGEHSSNGNSQPTGNPSNENNTSSLASSVDALTLTEIQSNPQSFRGERTVVGVVYSVNGFSFALRSDDAALILPIDYRGSQALPQEGATVIVTGDILIDCCDIAYMRVVEYEVVAK